MGVIFTEEEMDYWFEKGDADLFLEKIRRRQKTSQREKRHHPSVKNRHSSTVKGRVKDHHPSVKMIPASK